VSDRPEDVDAAFAQIVADLEREGVGSTLPDLSKPADGVAAEPEPDQEEPTASQPAGSAPAATWRGHDGEYDWSWGTDDEHYVPPEPPPLPRLRPLTIFALVLLVLGIGLLLGPGLIGLDARIGTPIALLALTCGGGLLLLRVRKNSPRDPDDNGAQV
jgi:hypothetical protein